MPLPAIPPAAGPHPRSVRRSRVGLGTEAGWFPRPCLHRAARVSPRVAERAHVPHLRPAPRRSRPRVDGEGRDPRQRDRVPRCRGAVALQPATVPAVQPDVRCVRRGVAERRGSARGAAGRAEDPSARLGSRQSSYLLHVDFVPEKGTELFALSCEKNLEGVVGKWTPGTYQADGRSTSWVKIKNPAYSQAEGRAELFEGKGRTRRPATPKLLLV